MSAPKKSLVDHFNGLQHDIIKDIHELSPEERFKILTRKLKPQHIAKRSCRLQERLQKIDEAILETEDKETIAKLRAKFLNHRANYDVIINMLHYLALIAFDSYFASHIQAELGLDAVVGTIGSATSSPTASQAANYITKKKRFENEDFPLLRAINNSLLFRNGLDEISENEKAEYRKEQMVWQIRALQNFEIAEAAFMLANGKGEKFMANITRTEMENDESFDKDLFKPGNHLKEGNVQILKGVKNRIQSKKEMIALMGKHGFDNCRTITDEKAQLEELEKIQQQLKTLSDGDVKYEEMSDDEMS